MQFQGERNADDLFKNQRKNGQIWELPLKKRLQML